MSSVSFDQLMKQYRQIVAQEKDLKGQKENIRDRLFSQIDEEVGPGREGGIEYGGFQAVRSLREKSEVRGADLITLLAALADCDSEELNLIVTQANQLLAGRSLHGLAFKLVVEEAEVAALLDRGELTQEEFMGCVTITKTPAISVKEAKA